MVSLCLNFHVGVNGDYIYLMLFCNTEKYWAKFIIIPTKTPIYSNKNNMQYMFQYISKF